MGTIKTTNIEPIADNGTVTLGSSGDTFTVPSGVTVNMSSATQTGVGGENTPAFEAYRSGSAQTITDSTDTKIQFNSEIFDTAGAYDASTNYRFTVPSGQAGKYFVYSQIWMQAQTSTTFRDCQLNLKKNGTTYKRCYWYFNNNPIRWIIPNITATMDLSVGDYIEMFIYTQTTDSATTSVTHDSDPESNFGAYKLIGV
tara:strand:+ start:359 stop:955 length:597 start_codon:yes stop_codon:yes gene_type:complete